MGKGVSYPLWSLCLQERLPAGPVAPQREKTTPEQVCWQDLWPHGTLTLERLDPVQGIHAETLCEELQLVGRTHDEKVGEGLSPVGGTDAGIGQECEEASPWWARSHRDSMWWTEHNPIPCPLQCCHRGLEKIQSKAKPGKKGEVSKRLFKRFDFICLYPDSICNKLNWHPQVKSVCVSNGCVTSPCLISTHGVFNSTFSPLSSWRGRVMDQLWWAPGAQPWSAHHTWLTASLQRCAPRQVGWNSACTSSTEVYRCAGPLLLEGKMMENFVTVSKRNVTESIYVSHKYNSIITVSTTKVTPGRV